MKKLIITISREFGSGGRELGKRLAEKLNIAYYDKEILHEISKKTQLAYEYVEQVVEKKPIVYYPITIARSINFYENYQVDHNITIFTEQSNVIKELASKSSCVIVGRCADYILREEKPYRIYVYSDMESKVNRCKEKGEFDEKLSDKQISRKIKKIDKQREKYYEFYTAQTWGDKLNYDICINTSNKSIKDIVDIIVEALK